jgi:hypothetical protein
MVMQKAQSILNRDEKDTAALRFKSRLTQVLYKDKDANWSTCGLIYGDRVTMKHAISLK